MLTTFLRHGEAPRQMPSQSQPKEKTDKRSKPVRRLRQWRTIPLPCKGRKRESHRSQAILKGVSNNRRDNALGAEHHPPPKQACRQNAQSL